MYLCGGAWAEMGDTNGARTATPITGEAPCSAVFFARGLRSDVGSHGLAAASPWGTTMIFTGARYAARTASSGAALGLRARRED